MMKIDILMTAPQTPALTALVDDHFHTHKLWLAEDRQAFLTACAPKIRGIVTNAMAGAGQELIEALPHLEIIASFGVGLDLIDIACAKARGIIVTTTPGVLNDCVADTGMALLLAASRRICEADRFLRAGRWQSERFPFSTSLRGKVCGILGLGQIGRAVAHRAEAFGLRIAYSNPSRKADVDYDYYPDPLSLARASDYLMLTLPGGENTRHLVDTRILEALGPTGFLINIARGSVVDQPALIAALRDHKIAGAGLDVFEDEPIVPPELMSLENVVLTPHIASATHETRLAMSQLAFANLQAHFDGQPILTPVS